MSALRVVVASDAIDQLDSQAAGVALARGWVAAAAAVGAEPPMVAVVPLAQAGLPLAAALAARFDGKVLEAGRCWRVESADGLAVGVEQSEGDESTADLGEWLAAALTARSAPPGTVVVDLTGIRARDAGAGFLAALGANRSLLGGAELIGVVANDESELPLLGLRGSVARHGFEARLDPAEVLRAEAMMSDWLIQLGQPDVPGAGAAGGSAAVVLALGGRLAGGAELCAELAGLDSTVGAADVVVTGCTAFHVGNRGGQTVRFVAALAESRQRPCLVFAVESSLSRREMRTFGVEAAHALSGTTVGPDEVTAAVVRAATGWLGAQRGNA